MTYSVAVLTWDANVDDHIYHPEYNPHWIEQQYSKYYITQCCHSTQIAIDFMECITQIVGRHPKLKDIDKDLKNNKIKSAYDKVILKELSNAINISALFYLCFSYVIEVGEMHYNNYPEVSILTRKNFPPNYINGCYDNDDFVECEVDMIRYIEKYFNDNPSEHYCLVHFF